MNRLPLDTQEPKEKTHQFFLDAFGGGKKPSKTPPSSRHFVSHSRSRSRSPPPVAAPLIDDDMPPTVSLYSLVPGHEREFQDSPSRYSLVESPKATPKSAHSVQSSRFGSPMDVDQHSPSINAGLGFSPATPSPLSANTTVAVTGFPLNVVDQTVELLKSLGVINYLQRDKQGEITVSYASSKGYQKALALDGRVIEGLWIATVNPGTAPSKSVERSRLGLLLDEQPNLTDMNSPSTFYSAKSFQANLPAAAVTSTPIQRPRPQKLDIPTRDIPEPVQQSDTDDYIHNPPIWPVSMATQLWQIIVGF